MFFAEEYAIGYTFQIHHVIATYFCGRRWEKVGEWGGSGGKEWGWEWGLERVDEN